MKLVVAGSNGRIGQRVVLHALRAGHSVLGLDSSSNEPILARECWDLMRGSESETNFIYRKIDLRDFNDLLNALQGFDAVIALAGCPDPTDYRVLTHNTNVVISWNILRACAELGINRVAQASSINVITMAFCASPRYHFFPIDESHPCEPDEPYGLSKVIMEMQADTIARRHPEMRIASLRPHYSVPSRRVANPANADDDRKKDLWGYVQIDSAADAFLRAITVDASSLPQGSVKNGEVVRWHKGGHEAFFIVAPTTASDTPSEELRVTHWPHVVLRDGFNLNDTESFFSCKKAEAMLGWVHRDSAE